MNRSGRYHSSRDVDRDIDDYDRAVKRRRDDRPDARDEGGQMIDPQYRTLCISPFSQRIPDDEILSAVYHEFKKFGEFTVKIVYSGSRRLAYADFRYPEDAYAGKQFHQEKLILFGEPVRIDPVYTAKPRGRSRSPVDIGGDSYRRRSPYAPRSAMKDGNNTYDAPRDTGSYDRAPVKDSRYTGSGAQSQHLPPEDDETATRTLFIGNLDYDMTADQLQGVFGRYGYVEDVDVKRAAAGSGAYAFVRYANLDMAFRAKVEMSGQTIGRHQCRIGYGKVMTSNCLWVGGIGPWLTPDALGRIFGRHANVQRVEWPTGKTYAYIVFATVEDAKTALGVMRGAPLGGPDRRLRIDYADVSHIGMNFDVPWNARDGDHPGNRQELEPNSDRRTLPDDGRFDRRDDSVRKQHPSGSPDRSRLTDCAPLSVTSIAELAGQLPVVWNGLLMLKNSAFATKLHLVEGDSHLVDVLLRDHTTDQSPLKITQRLRLDDSKLSEVRRRISLAGPSGYCIMLAMPASDGTAEAHHRPLKNLVTYLRQKDAAGVILLPSNNGASTGSRASSDTSLLHAFPSCEFATQQLTRRAPQLNSGISKEEHLVMVLVRLTP